MVTDRTITPYREGPYTWPSREQLEAYAAALRELFLEFPPATDLDTFDRNYALDRLESGAIYVARAFAIRSGVPEHRLLAVEALLF